MSKITYASLKLQNPTEIALINFNGVNIEVKKYLPHTEKMSIIARVADEVSDDGFVYSHIEADALLAMEVVFNYTNIIFTEKQREDVMKLYDAFNESGLLTRIFEIIEDEYNYLLNALDDELTYRENHYASAWAFFTRMLEIIPEKMTGAMNALKDVDLSKYSNITETAAALGMNNGANAAANTNG